MLWSHAAVQRRLRSEVESKVWSTVNRIGLELGLGVPGDFPCALVMGLDRIGVRV